MFSGIFESSLDVHRIILPSHIRKILYSMECESLVVMTQANRVGSFPVVPRRSLSGRINNFSRIVKMDARGRILLPEALRHELQEGTKTVMIVGLGRYFELWSPNKLTERQRVEDEDLSVNGKEG